MTPELFLASPIRGALSILPPTMNSLEARAMITAICLQESRLISRRQVSGPARGYAQFEQGGGVAGVFNHPSTAGHTKVVCAALDVTPTIAGIYNSLEFNDILTAAMARLLLWTLPDALAPRGNPDKAWLQYLEAWRPGKPHKETWSVNFVHAWLAVDSVGDIEELNLEAALIKDAAVAFITSLDKLRVGVVGLDLHPVPKISTPTLLPQ